MLLGIPEYPLVFCPDKTPDGFIAEFRAGLAATPLWLRETLKSAGTTILAGNLTDELIAKHLRSFDRATSATLDLRPWEFEPALHIGSENIIIVPAYLGDDPLHREQWPQNDQVVAGVELAMWKALNAKDFWETARLYTQTPMVVDVVKKDIAALRQAGRYLSKDITLAAQEICRTGMMAKLLNENDLTFQTARTLFAPLHMIAHKRHVQHKPLSGKEHNLIGWFKNSYEIARQEMLKLNNPAVRRCVRASSAHTASDRLTP